MTTNRSAAEAPAAAAMRDQHAQARALASELRRDLAAVGRLFGVALQYQLEARIESATDRYEDALHEAADALDNISRRANDADQRCLLLATRISELNDVVVQAALELQRRYGEIRQPVPAALTHLVEAGCDIWAFVYPPVHELHVHDTDKTGACRHPLCTHRADPEEPF